jgi:DNA polymerase
MPEHTSADDFLPSRLSLPALRNAAKACRGCDLYLHATQTVFGEGPRSAEIMIVGEMPGDREDQEGKPFVGPAGNLLDAALREAGVERKDVYVTNAVKHFRFEQRGKRRIHKKPSAREVKACKPWLRAEISVIAPKLILCLGATAAQALMGPAFRITRMRGQPVENPYAPFLVATYHPSAILRAPDKESRERMRREFVEDLRNAIKLLKSK